MAAMAAAVVPFELGVEPAPRLRGDLRLPGDKSISHRALMLALLADGQTRITGAGDGADVRSTAGIIAALGAEVARALSQDGAGNIDYTVRSGGAAAIAPPAGALDCGNSGTSMRLFAGILAGVPMRATLDGDASLRTRPMARVIHPLRAMGAAFEGSVPGPGELAPIRMRGRRPLKPIVWTTPVASAQVKSSILLAGLAAEGTTFIGESMTRDHTERMLRARGVSVRSRPRGEADERGGHIVEIDGPATVRAIDQAVPGDPSAAAFWVVAAAIHPDAEVRLRGVGVNATRRAVIDLLNRMGAGICELGESDHGVGEPVADLIIQSSMLRPIEMTPEETAEAIDEIPVLCLAATQASGRSLIRGAGELRHKETDRIAGIVDGLSRLGARITADGDDIAIDGPTQLRGAVVDSHGDHRLALTFAIAGLIATGSTTVRGADSMAISYPTFLADLERIRS